MKKILVLCALAVALVTSSAFAQGVDLSVNACPNNAGAATDGGAFDCTGGVGVVLLATFVNGTPEPDMNSAELSFDFQVAGDVTSDAGFWDFAIGNPSAIGTNFPRPTTGCTGYSSTWPNGSIAGSQAFPRSSNHQNISTVVARSTGLSVTAGQKLFGIQLVIDASTSAEAGGAATATGCADAACFVLNSIQPRTVSGADPAPLNGPSGLLGNQVTVNGGVSPMCLAVPTKKHTWGQLKSLYR